jgi:hypothetical protein
MAFDAGFMMNAMLPGADEAFGGTSGFLSQPAAQAVMRDLKPILESGRISLLCTELERKTKTAYLILETDEAKSLGRIYQTYAPLSAMMGAAPAQLKGWDSAVSMTIPFRGGASTNIVFAHRNGAFLAGIGDIGDFSKELEIRDDYRNYLSKDNLMNVILSSNMYDIFLGMMETMPDGTAGTSQMEVRAFAAGMSAMRDSFDTMCGNFKPSGKAEGKIILTEGGDPLAAMFEMFARTAVMMPRR